MSQALFVVRLMCFVMGGTFLWLAAGEIASIEAEQKKAEARWKRINAAHTVSSKVSSSSRIKPPARHADEEEASQASDPFLVDTPATERARAGKDSNLLPPEPDSPFQLTIPRLGIERYVIPGATQAHLKQGPAWLTETVEPGQTGNSIIAGHRETHFRCLRLVQLGDRITISRNGERTTFKVDSIYVVDAKNREPLMGTQSSARLTLISCYPFNFLGPAPKRFIVRATAIQRSSDVGLSGG